MGDSDAMLERALAGDRRSLARAITMLELGDPRTGASLSALIPRRRRAAGAPHVIGLTGPPGAGKSTFADVLVGLAREAGRRVAVVAVDPSSPFTGGAILGDRIRMERHTGDDGAYVRSLSSRGNLGGLSGATSDVVDLLDVAGFDLVLVETVGVGQSELGVMEVADTVLVVLTPESGDAVQAMKAGLLEIADLFAINKADRPGADRLAKDLEQSIALDEPEGWVPRVFCASATDGRGVAEVAAAAEEHRQWIAGAGAEAWRARRAAGRTRRFLDLVAEAARGRAAAALAGPIGSALRDGLDPRLAVLELEASP